MLPNLKLKNPPIKEALISIAFSHPLGIKLEDLDKFCDKAKGNYPNKKPQFESTVKIEEEEVIKNTEHVGYMLVSEDKKKYIKLNLNSVSFHRVEPYQSWEHLISETKIYWSELCILFPQMQIKQISVRYINVMGIKFENGETFHDYLTLLPDIPDIITTVVEGYFLQIKIPEPIKGLNSVVTEFFTLNQDIVEITLDINVMKNFDSLSINDTNLWILFNDLRAFKNNIFFNSITEKTKNLYNV